MSFWPVLNCLAWRLCRTRIKSWQSLPELRNDRFRAIIGVEQRHRRGDRRSPKTVACRCGGERLRSLQRTRRLLPRYVHWRSRTRRRSSRLESAGIVIVADPKIALDKEPPEAISSDRLDDSVMIDDPLQVYLREVAKVPLLTPEDETRLAESIATTRPMPIGQRRNWWRETCG